MRGIPISNSDYIKDNKEIKSALKARTCTFYRKGFWYWISQDNSLKCSTLQGKKTKTVYSPSGGRYIDGSNRIMITLYSQ